MTFRNCVAVDLGASSGRVMLARYERECRSLTLREIHRFNNGLHSQNGYVTWNVDSLESAIRLGLNKVCEEGIRIDSIGIDTWGVDFVLLDQQGQRVGLPVAYRDSRTNGLMAQAQQQECQHHCASQRCHLGNKSGKRKTRTSPDKNILRVANWRQ